MREREKKKKTRDDLSFFNCGTVPARSVLRSTTIFSVVATLAESVMTAIYAVFLTYNICLERIPLFSMECFVTVYLRKNR